MYNTTILNTISSDKSSALSSLNYEPENLDAVLSEFKKISTPNFLCFIDENGDGYYFVKHNDDVAIFNSYLNSDEDAVPSLMPLSSIITHFQENSSEYKELLPDAIISKSLQCKYGGCVKSDNENSINFHNKHADKLSFIIQTFFLFGEKTSFIIDYVFYNGKNKKHIKINCGFTLTATKNNEVDKDNVQIKKIVINAKSKILNHEISCKIDYDEDEFLTNQRYCGLGSFIDTISKNNKFTHFSNLKL